MSLALSDLRLAQRLVITGFIVIAIGGMIAVSSRSPRLDAVQAVLREKCEQKYLGARTLADTLRADNFIPEPGLQGRGMQDCSFFRPFLRHRDSPGKFARYQSPSLLAAQHADTLHLRVGSPEVQAADLQPFIYRFTGTEEDCDDPSPAAEDEIDQLELARTARGAVWRYVVVSHFSNGNNVVDTSWYDRRTLAPLRARYHSSRAPGSTGFDVSGSRVSWFDVNGGGSLRLDTTLTTSAFLEGSGDLLVPILAGVLSSGHVVDWPIVTLEQSESNPQPRLVVVRNTAQRAHTSLQRPNGVPEGSIPLDLGDGVYSWLSATGHEEIARQFPPGEGTCASLYLRSDIVKR